MAACVNAVGGFFFNRLANNSIQKWSTHSAVCDGWALLTPCPERDLPPLLPQFWISEEKKHKVWRREQQLENTHV